MSSPPKTIEGPLKVYANSQADISDPPSPPFYTLLISYPTLFPPYYSLDSGNNGMTETKFCFHEILFYFEDPKNYAKVLQTSYVVQH